MISGSILVTAFAFLAGFLTIFAVNLLITDLFMKEREIQRKRMEAELLDRERKRAREEVRGRLLEGLAEETARIKMERKSIVEQLQEWIDQAGMKATPGNLIGMSVACGLVAGAPVAVLGQLLGGYALVGIPAALTACWLPLVYVLVKRGRRLDALRRQLPDTLDLMGRILRAGQTMTQAMLAVATEFRAPVATEFGFCYEQQNLGLSQESALRDLARRTGVLEIKIFVLALLVHRKTGGNLAELLDQLATIVRERFKIRGKIRAMTAEGRLQAMILLALPPIMFVLLCVVNRTYALKLLDYPVLILVSLISMVFGAVWIRKIVNFDF